MSVSKEIMLEQGYKKSIDFLKESSSEYGFLASPINTFNYRRVWSRDGVINGLAALISGDKELIEIFKKTLYTIAKYQGKRGQLPSNVDPVKKSISYGRTTGKVDATLWYVIGCGQYYKYTKDKKFLSHHLKKIKKAIEVLEAWEFNQKGFLFVPDSGDWADESPRHGYILYDQLLYYKALLDYDYLLKSAKKRDNRFKEKAKLLKKKIEINFWLDRDEKEINQEEIYHPEMFEGLRKIYKGKQKFWIENFHHHAIYKRFDSFANSLSILFGFSNDSQREKIFDYISGILGSGYLVPAFYPIIFPIYKRKWKELRGSYSFQFKNKPYHSHNGGLWPVVTGFYISALVEGGKKEMAMRYLKNLNYANSLNKDNQNKRNKKENDEWGFYEYHHGKKRTPEGRKGLAWSASAFIIGYQSIRGKNVFT